MYVHLFDSG